MNHLPSRRDVVKSMMGVAAGAALGVPLLTRAAGPASAPTPRTRALRLAHLTDFHIQPERRAADGAAACWKHLASLPEQPGLVITGGDLIMDGFERDEARTRLQWELFTKTLRDGCGIPVRHCLGNHDIWGWNKPKSRTTGDEPRWGKKWAVETLGLPERFYSFDQAGWRFVVLDSTHVDPDNPNGYIALLDEAQFDWLARDLASTPATTPVVVVSHIPILSAVVLVPRVKPDNDQLDLRGVQLKREIPAGLMHTDAHRLRMLFRAHPNVKLCLSGHLHRTDRIDFEGVTYLCGGAVCGAWWEGPNDLTREGYRIIDLYSDGSFETSYEEYGWNAEPA